MPTTIHITEEDYVNAGLLNGEMTRRSKRWHLAADILFVVLGCIAWYFDKRMIAFGLWGAGIGGAVGPLLIRQFLVPVLLKRHYRKYPKIQKPMTISLGDEGLLFAADDGTGRLSWSEIHGWRENIEYLLVYLAPRMYHVLPKRIENEGFPLNELKQRLIENVGSAI
jgi:hypothetical protein